MTLEQIVTRIFVGLGEPSDLQIYAFGTTTVDTALPGWRTLVDVVNQSQLELSMWKFPEGHQLRMRLNEATAAFQTATLAATLNQASTGVIGFNGLAGADNALAGRLVVGPNGTGLILASDANVSDTTLYLTKMTGTFALSEAVTIHQREYLWNAAAGVINPIVNAGVIQYRAANGVPLEVIDLVDIATETHLETTTKFVGTKVVASTVATPTSFVKIPGGVRMDSWPPAGLTYMVRYIRAPRTLAYTDVAVEPEVPPQFHRALELMGLIWGYRRAQESTDAYSAKKDLVDFLRTVRTEYDIQDDNVQGQVKFYPNGR